MIIRTLDLRKCERCGKDLIRIFGTWTCMSDECKARRYKEYTEFDND